jgi:hypothetical protein
VGSIRRKTENEGERAGARRVDGAGADRFRFPFPVFRL